MFAQRLAQVSASATLKVAAEAERLRRAGFNVVDFSAGEPDFPTPEHVKAAGKAAIDANFTRYTAAAGIRYTLISISSYCPLKHIVHPT